jgi:hypothetical protein
VDFATAHQLAEQEKQPNGQDQSESEQYNNGFEGVHGILLSVNLFFFLLRSQCRRFGV